MSQLSDLTPLEKFRHFSSLKRVPLQASLELTNRCNERCTHCYLDNFKDDPNRVLTLENWFKILRELREAGTLYIVLMGGEAMLSPYFWDVAKEASRLNFHVSMISNGLKIKDREIALRMRDVGIHVVTFSLYSLDSEIHDKMTSVKGSWQKTMAAIEHCEAAGVKPGINCLLTEANARGVFDLYDWAIKNNYEMKVDPTVTPKLGGDLGPTKYRATRETLLWFYRERSRRWPKSRPQSSRESPGNFVCNAAKGKCAINPYGDLLPCIEIREPLGNLVESSFAELWYAKYSNPWRDLKVGDLENTGGLGTYSFCDHCPGMAAHEHGNGKKITEFSKMMAEVRQQVSEELSP